jgi:hypothetical protein
MLAKRKFNCDEPWYDNRGMRNEDHGHNKRTPTRAQTKQTQMWSNPKSFPRITVEMEKPTTTRHLEVHKEEMQHNATQDSSAWNKKTTYSKIDPKAHSPQHPTHNTMELGGYKTNKEKPTLYYSSDLHHIINALNILDVASPIM